MDKKLKLTKIKELGKKTKEERNARIEEINDTMENIEGQEKLSKSMQKLQLEKAILEDMNRKY